jgi:chromosomal replication initiator protein
MDSAAIWSAALGELQLQMTSATFDTWLRNTRLLKYEEGVFVIAVSSGYAKDWLENRLLGTVKRTLAHLAGRTVGVKFVVWNQQPSAPADLPLIDTSPPASTAAPPSLLNPRYRFDDFIVGSANRLAHAASLAVAEDPGGAYNPLFIYGGVGLGKTHLLTAIGHAAHAKGLRVLYVSSEQFTNDLIEAIRSHNTEAFRDKYRTADILLVDDVQFIAGKESTQEEFFHTFNALHGNGRQIVLSSDRAPKAMSTLEERLCSRFEWGLIADIQPPNLETRLAILRSKCASLAEEVPDDVLMLIASQVQRNIRELEGALNRVLALANLSGSPLDTNMAKAALDSLLATSRSSVSADAIIEAVARRYQLELAELRGRSRRAAVARPRQIAMYLLRSETGASLPQIGALLGGRDHTTVLYGCDRIEDLLAEDESLRRDVAALRQALHTVAG